jgi:hypothetical protein
MAAIGQKDYFSAEKSFEFTKSHRIPVMDSFSAAVIKPERRNKVSAITAREYFKIYFRQIARYYPCLGVLQQLLSSTPFFD